MFHAKTYWPTGSSKRSLKVNSLRSRSWLGVLRARAAGSTGEEAAFDPSIPPEKQIVTYYTKDGELRKVNSQWFSLEKRRLTLGRAWVAGPASVRWRLSESELTQ
jgi:hypothetical protein